MDSQNEIVAIVDTVLTPYNYSSSSISVLPNELLVRIFSHFARLRCNTSSGECYCAGRCIGLPWIKVTHVCRHWREAALASPTIWASSTWDTSNEMPSEWIERLTSRSASMPISLDVSNHEDPCIVANRIALLRRNISRIAQLCVIDKLFSCSILPAIFPILAEPAPCLQHLYIFTSSTQRQEKLRLIPPFHQST
ncbi:uncharacterized protein STEHIDRAFT_125123, partial [Stereum hirsutum FP-91666 SS1]|uniref:uncharacterized protein n=1 Tax=Stereum hirsutum (strain FP-91666) TaxID=721885 RepID=UPI000444A1E8